MLGGNYKVFFVVTLRRGRIVMEDKVTIQKILAAANIDRYGIIVNQVTPSEWAKNVENEETKKELEMNMLSHMDPVTQHIFFQPSLTELAGKENKYLDMPKLKEFIFDDTPSTVIKKDDVKEIDIEDFDKASRDFQELSQELENNQAKRAEQMKALKKKHEEEKAKLLKDLEEAKSKNKNLANRISPQM